MTTNGGAPYPLIIGRPRTGSVFSPTPPFEAPRVIVAPAPPPVAPVYVVGVDLGQAQDYTAIVVDEATRISPDAGGVVYTHRVTHLERPRLGTPYPVVVQRVCEVCAALPAAPTLVIDGTGVGRAVVDMFGQAQPRCASLLPVTITGGHEEAQQPDGGWHVPKKNLVGVVAVALQNKRLQVARALPEAGTLTKELLAFRAKITASGSVTYGAPDWRAGAHDDLVLAVALALWAVSRPQWSWTAY